MLMPVIAEPLWRGWLQARNNSASKPSKRTMKMNRLSLLALAVALTRPLAAAPPAQEWPQFGGPNRNFTVATSADRGLAKTWSAAGPTQLWRRELGEGFSALAVQDDRLYTMYQRGEQEVVIAMNSRDGRTVWEHAYTAPITVNMSRAPGPRSTPLIVGDTVFTTGATGRLHALNKRTGAVLWAHDLFEQFKGHVQDEYYAASPLAYRDTIIVPVGASGGALMAFHQKTGAIVWRAHDFKISYASPILIEVDGQPQAVVVMESEVIGVDPGTGALLWKHPHANRTKTNVSTPLWGDGNLLFVSSAYDSVGRMLHLARTAAGTTVTERWTSRDLRIHVANPVRIGDTIFGSSGDFGPAFFSALDVRTGQVKWTQRDVVKASVVLVDGRFVMLNENGELLLASPAETGLTIHSAAEVLGKPAWTPPSLAGKTLYLRDRLHVIAVDLR